MAWEKTNHGRGVLCEVASIFQQTEELPFWDLAWVEDKPQDPEDEMGRKLHGVVVVNGVFQVSSSLVAKRHSQTTVTQSVRKSAGHATRV